MISFVTEGLATAIPPTALVTETAGVKIPSAMVKPVPNKHWYTSNEVRRGEKKLQIIKLTHTRRGHLNLSDSLAALEVDFCLYALSPVRILSASRSFAAGGNSP
jgi:hypothetical protein